MPDVEKIKAGIMLAGVSPLQTTTILSDIGSSFQTDEVFFSVAANAAAEWINRCYDEV
jgi:pyrroline-5-carboxylate reductase